MTFFPDYAELLGREMRMVRLNEAEQQRLIRTVTLAKSPHQRNMWSILRDRWETFWSRKIFRPFSRVPRNSHSM